VNGMLVKINSREYIFCAPQKFAARKKSEADYRQLVLFH